MEYKVSNDHVCHVCWDVTLQVDGGDDVLGREAIHLTIVDGAHERGLHGEGSEAKGGIGIWGHFMQDMINEKACKGLLSK